MKNLRSIPWYFAMIFALLASLSLPLSTKAGGTVGDGTPESCTEAALNSALADGGMVIFDCGPDPVTIPISAQKTITANTTINGNSLITLDGGSAIRLFSVDAGDTLNLQSITLANGSADQGGAILNNGSLNVNACKFNNNLAPGGLAGAIYNAGNLSIASSEFTDNIASAGLAGAIYNLGRLEISSSTFSGNFGGLAGGALINTNTGNVTIAFTTFTSNTGYHGGGISNSGTMTIRYSSLGYNTTTSGFGGGIYNDGNLTISTTTFDTNGTGTGLKGGAIFNGGSAVIETSSFYNNSAPGGFAGGIYNEGELTINADSFAGNIAGAGIGGAILSTNTASLQITNSTFTGNNGGFGGGGLDSGGSATLVNSTFTDNIPYGLVANGSSEFNVKNTIVAGSTTANCSGTITSMGNNLEDAHSCGFTAAGDLQDTDPMLGPFVDNGGPTQTRALLHGSPAINGGSNIGCPAADQRGVRRPLLGICDIGAYEFGNQILLPLVRK